MRVDREWKNKEEGKKKWKNRERKNMRRGKIGVVER